MNKNKPFLVQYTLPYTHIVTVGVHAISAGEAIDKAREAFESGDIWNDNSDMPLLQDCYEETAELETMEFAAIETVEKLKVLRENTTTLMIPEHHNSSIDLADDRWTKETV